MEIKFMETACPCLRRLVDQTQVREQTQELRIPEPMADIGRILGCWGRPIIRGKEWSGGSMRLTGGVQGCVLYEAEDGSPVQSMDVWIPFQLRWDLPQTQKDGKIWAWPWLKSMDVRSTSARKLLVRANVGARGVALEESEAAVYRCGEIPEDVQLLTANYPMELPREYGEKAVTVEEELTLPGTYPAVEQILRYDLTPVVQEQRVIASRLVFRGKGLLHMLYSSGGQLCTWDAEIPFSQFADLDRDYGQDTFAQIQPILTNLELQEAEGKLLLKAEMTAQYIIRERTMVQLIEDAYSPRRQTTPLTQTLHFPAELDRTVMQLRAEQSVPASAAAVTDVSWMPEQPQIEKDGDSVQVTLPGQFQVLFTDAEGKLQWANARCEQQISISADGETAVDAVLTPDALPQAAIRGGNLELTAPCRMEAVTSANGGMNMLSGLELGELQQPDPQRPSLVLRRCDDGGLWELAKSCGSTVEAIRRANGLENEPDRGQMLLIPVC